MLCKYHTEPKNSNRYGFMSAAHGFRWYAVCVYFSDSNMLHFSTSCIKSCHTSHLSGEVHPLMLVLDPSRSYKMVTSRVHQNSDRLLLCVEEVLLHAWTPVICTSPNGKYDCYATRQNKKKGKKNTPNQMGICRIYFFQCISVCNDK